MDSDIPQLVNIEYEIQLTPLALEMLIGVKDKRHQKSLSDRIDKLKTDPEKQGKPLIDKLKGYRSVRAVGQRYRIIYKVELEKVVVLVVGVGRQTTSYLRPFVNFEKGKSCETLCFTAFSVV